MNNRELFDLYMSDTRENLDSISQNILKLEEDTHNKDYISNIFRAAHTIKGAAASMEFEDITTVTHKLEDLFGAIRDEKIEVTKIVIDIVLKSLDCLEELHEQLEDESITANIDVIKDIENILLEQNSNTTTTNSVSNAQIPKASVNATLSKSEIMLRALNPDSRFFCDAVQTDLMTEATKISISQFLEQGFSVYYISIKIDEQCKYNTARAFMVMENLSRFGEVIGLIPDTSTIESDNFEDTDIDILFICSEEPEKIYESLNGVLEIEVEEVIKLTKGHYSYEEDISLSSDVLNSNKPVGIRLFNDIQEEDAPKVDSEPIAHEPVENDVVNNRDKVDSKNIPKDTHKDMFNDTPKDISKEHKTESMHSSSIMKSDLKTKNNKETSNTVIKVYTRTLDNLMNEEGELLLENNRQKLLIEKMRRGNVSINEVVDNLEDICGNISKILANQQSIIMSTRMFPLEQLFSIFPRMIRDLSSNLGKKVDLIVEGQDTELDRTILEKVSDPLKHIIRNAIDHGIESPEERAKTGKPEKGTVKISAKQESSSVIITVQDDGKGMDVNALRKKAVEKGLYSAAQAEKLTDDDILSIIFMAGFSTASEITEVSGRGVGMDIVRSSLSEIGGIIDIDTKLGKGTTFTVKIPLTLAISKSLLVTLDDDNYIVLINYVQEVIEVERKDIKRIQDKEHIILRDKIYPLVYLRDIYKYERKNFPVETIALVHNNGRSMGLVIDSCLGEQDIVVKSLNKYFNDIKYVAGLTKLGDGSIPVIVDITTVMDDFLR